MPGSRRAFAAAALVLALVTTGCGSAAPAEPAAGATASGSFPVTVEHAFGSTLLEAEPERVVVVGYSEQDYYLALGTVPVAIRDWYGDMPSATWPWAQSYLKGQTPVVLPRAELDYEQILGLDPDVIVGVSAGLTREQYDTLAKIAPTVAQPNAADPWAVTWQDKTRTAGRILGKSAEAEQMIAGIEKRITDATVRYPRLKGASTVFASGFEGQFYLFSPNATGSQVLLDLGLTMSEEVNRLTDNANDYFVISKERFDLLDVDVAVWSEPRDDALIEQLLANPLYTGRAVHTEGRALYLGKEANGAFSFSSVLSLPYVLDTIVPALAIAADGDPATTGTFS